MANTYEHLKVYSIYDTDSIFLYFDFKSQGHTGCEQKTLAVSNIHVIGLIISVL